MKKKGEESQRGLGSNWDRKNYGGKKERITRKELIGAERKEEQQYYASQFLKKLHMKERRSIIKYKKQSRK